MKNKLLVASLVLSLGLVISAPVLALDASGAADIRNALKKLNNQRAELKSATLNSVTGTTLSVTDNSTNYTINTDGSVILRRKFGAKSTLAEMSPGDTLNIIGKWTNDAHTIIQAKLVRDMSIQKRNGVFFGNVSALTSTGWTMTTVVRGSQSVTVSTTTKFIDRKGQIIALTDIKVGDLVRVHGLWDNTLNTITEVDKVKDYNIPVKTAAPVATPSARQ